MNFCHRALKLLSVAFILNFVCEPLFGMEEIPLPPATRVSCRRVVEQAVLVGASGFFGFLGTARVLGLVAQAFDLNYAPVYVLSGIVGFVQVAKAIREPEVIFVENAALFAVIFGIFDRQ